MIIQPNWTITDQGPWQLIYNDASIISLLEVEGITSTQGYIFAGTKEECEAEIIRLNLPWASGFVLPVVEENIEPEIISPVLEIIEPEINLPVVEENIEPTVAKETVYKLIHNGTYILCFSVDVDSSNVEGTTVVGTFQECQEEITRLGLTWSSPELVGDEELEITE
jgi:hypothetical protein